MLDRFVTNPDCDLLDFTGGKCQGKSGAKPDDLAAGARREPDALTVRVKTLQDPNSLEKRKTTSLFKYGHLHTTICSPFRGGQVFKIPSRCRVAATVCVKELIEA